jgi:S-DNA-T family DNA segregation ATPase FtsK/SpoIIIE
LVQDLAGVSLIALALLTFVSLVAFSSAGQFGNAVEHVFRILFGVGAYFLPVFLAFAGVVLIAGRNPASRNELIAGSVIVFFISISWWHYAHSTGDSQFASDEMVAYGGFVGAGIAALLRHLFGVATPVIFLAGSVATVVWMTDMRLALMVAGPVERFSALMLKLRAEARSREEKSYVKQSVGKATITAPAVSPVPPAPRAVLSPRQPEPAPSDPFNTPTVVASRVQIQQKPNASPPVKQPQLGWDRLGEVVDQVNKDYKLPPLDLLTPAPPPPKKLDSAIAEKQAVLMQTLNDFKIGGNVQQVAVGPTVTRYEVQLEPGILVKKIVALADNLAMSLAAIDVRVEAPIPGKAAIGIEVPNDVTQMVSMRECIETTEFVKASSKLTFALGKDVSGVYKYADLARMPHLLIGGSTNSGKSVCLNSLITSILYRATPREVRFVMIDPKRVELSLYDGIPHLLSPVIKGTKQAAGIFRSVLKEMDKRYDAFALLGTRNLEGYNNKVAPKDRLPFIVLVVDELADLMMTQGPEVETSICRLAQLARATGIHLVIATQRPSVDVITGTIKANISSRIAFAVATQIDSRTIIDSPGADRLIGRGDMLFLPIDASKPVRIQGCYVSEKETESLVKYLQEQESPNYTMTPSDGPSGYSDGDGDEDESTDELFEPCVRWLVQQRQASTSSLQRKFKIGYTRAARLIESMEAKNIVGSQDGVKPREVLLAPENVEVYFGGKQQGIIEGMND